MGDPDGSPNFFLADAKWLIPRHFKRMRQPRQHRLNLPKRFPDVIFCFVVYPVSIYLSRSAAVGNVDRLCFGLNVEMKHDQISDLD